MQLMDGSQILRLNIEKGGMQLDLLRFTKNNWCLLRKYYITLYSNLDIYHSMTIK